MFLAVPMRATASSNSNEAVCSNDGINWASTMLPSSQNWQSVCYGNGKFVAVASDSNIAAYADASLSVVEQLSNAGIAKKSDITNAIISAAPSACKVTLTASGWDSTAKTQSATVSGVLEDESKQLILPMPAAASLSAYNDAGILCTGQGAGTLTFQCETVPTAAITVYVTITPVNFS